MSPADEVTLTVGWIGRHTPKRAGAGGREAAILDIAQDLLLRELHDNGAPDALVFKGGTNRTTTARDMYDLAWVAQHQREIGGLDTDLIRRLAVLKIWVDANGIAGSNADWQPRSTRGSFRGPREKAWYARWTGALPRQFEIISPSHNTLVGTIVCHCLSRNRWMPSTDTH